MRRKFEIGDRVVAISSFDGNDSIVGVSGVVCGPITELWCGVRYDAPIKDGHSCRGSCDSPYGWETGFESLEYEASTSSATDLTISIPYEELNI